MSSRCRKATRRTSWHPPAASLLPRALVALALMVAQAAAEPNVPAGDGASASDTATSVDGDRSAPAIPVAKPVAPRPLTIADLPPSSVFAPRRPAGLTAPPIDLNAHAGNGPYRALVEREALAFGVPAEIADAVMAVESSYNPGTIGADGEIGLMQLLPSTASMLGFTGSAAELAVPETNIHYGVMYLAEAWRLAGQDICTATMKYRAGHGETRFSARSVDYCLRVRAHLSARGYPVTGAVPVATFGQPFAAGGARGRLQLARGAGAVDLAALNAQLREVTDSIVVRTRH